MTIRTLLRMSEVCVCVWVNQKCCHPAAVCSQGMRSVTYWVPLLKKKGGSVSTWWQTERMRVRRCRQKSVTLNRADVSGRVCPNQVGGNSPDKREQSTKKKKWPFTSSKNNPTAFQSQTNIKLTDTDLETPIFCSFVVSQTQFRKFCFHYQITETLYCL